MQTTRWCPMIGPRCEVPEAADKAAYRETVRGTSDGLC